MGQRSISQRRLVCCSLVLVLACCLAACIICVAPSTMAALVARALTLAACCCVLLACVQIGRPAIELALSSIEPPTADDGIGHVPALPVAAVGVACLLLTLIAFHALPSPSHLLGDAAVLLLPTGTAVVAFSVAPLPFVIAQALTTGAHPTATSLVAPIALCVIAFAGACAIALVDMTPLASPLPWALAVLACELVACTGAFLLARRQLKAVLRRAELDAHEARTQEALAAAAQAEADLVHTREAEARKTRAALSKAAQAEAEMLSATKAEKLRTAAALEEVERTQAHAKEVIEAERQRADEARAEAKRAQAQLKEAERSIEQLKVKDIALDERIERFTKRYGLTKREAAVIREAAHGYSRARMAEHLHLSQATVSTHIQKVYRKVQVHSMQELLNQVRNFE